MSKLTIQQIAELAGVNKATVSRVINGSTKISEKTRKKVEAIMKQYNYVPNSMARGLAFNRTFMVGFCVDYTDRKSYANPFFYKVLQGIEEVVYARDYQFLMMSDHNFDRRDSAFERMVAEHRVDGLILPGTLLTERNYQLLVEHDMPFVVTGGHALGKGNVHWVDIDNRQAGQILTEHLIRLGYRRIVLFATEASVKRDKFVADRIHGYRDTMLNHRLDPRIIHRVEQLEACGGPGADPVQAVIVTSQERLIDVLDWGHRHPVDPAVALATFDRVPMARYLKFPIHFVEVDLEMMGREAAKMLFALMDKEEDVPPFVSIQTKIGNSEHES